MTNLKLLPNIIWANVKNYEGIYQVSSNGEIKSLSRLVKHPKKDYYIISRYLKPVKMNNGYLTVTLSKNGVQKPTCVHRIVAEAFVPNYKKLEQVNHKNGDKTDNKVFNLEWMTRSENMLHASSLGYLK